MKKVKQTGTLCLALCLLLSSLTACGNAEESKETKKQETEKQQTEMESTEESESESVGDDAASRKNVSDDLPEMTFGGQSYRAAQQVGNRYEFYSEELTGEGENDAVFNRNLKIESRFDVKIETVDYDSLSAITSDVEKLVASGTDAYEVASHGAYRSSVPIRAGVYRNWNEVEYVDFSRPWWNQLANEQNTINGILYTATGDINVTSLLYTYAIFFNMDLALDNGITAESLYQLVYDGEWTIDKMIEITSEIYEDLNGDGNRDNGDRYGYAAWPGISADAWLAAFDQPITAKNEDGFPTVAFMTDKTVSALEKISNFYYNTTGAYADMSTAEYEVTMFVNNQVVMIPSIFNDAFTNYRYMDASYGIIPYPKWDEAQERYLTNARDQYTVLGIPGFKGDDDLAFIGVITEAMAAESYRSVFPAYYDIALKNRYSADPDTAKMVDLILAGRNFDFAFLFGDSEFQNVPYMFRNLLNARKTDVASAYASIKKAVNKSVKKIEGYYTPEQ